MQVNYTSGRRTSLDNQTRHPCIFCADLLRRAEWVGGVFRTAPHGRRGRYAVLCLPCRARVKREPHLAAVIGCAVEVFGAPVPEARAGLEHMRPGLSLEALAGRFAAPVREATR